MKIKFIALSLAALFTLGACGNKADRQEQIAAVNNAPIHLKDFRKEVALASRRDPNLKITDESLETILDGMIEKKLLVQEAVKRGLSQDEKFLDSLKAYWEQTLIRELIEAKNKEWSDRLFVTDEEVKRHYERMTHKITVKTAEFENEQSAQEAKDKFTKGEHVEGEQITGPLLIENIQLHNPLYNAFYQSAGEARVFKGEENYIVIQVIRKEDAPAPPMEKVYTQIKENLLEQKKQKALDEWLHEMKKGSSIKIKKDKLKKAEHE